MKGKKKYLFEYEGEHMNYYRYRGIWDFVMVECGFSYTPHDTRHTFITNMRKAGVEKIIYQRIAGYECDDVTDKVYTNISKEKLIEAVDRLP